MIFSGDRYDRHHHQGARAYSTSFLLTERDTRTTLEAVLWRDDTQTTLDWFIAVMSAPLQSGANLGLVIGPDFSIIIGNLARNIRENRLGVLAAVLACKFNPIAAPGC